MSERYFKLLPGFGNLFFERIGMIIRETKICDGYRELVGVTIDLPRLDKDVFEATDLDLSKADAIINSIFDLEDGLVHYLNKNTPYFINRYVEAYKQLIEICHYFVRANDLPDNDPFKLSRQQAINFDKIHCFTSIQFLVRGERLIVIANLRSCNYADNFMMDLYLVYRFARRVYNVLNANSIEGCTNPKIDVIMNIGSLHIFE